MKKYIPPKIDEINQMILEAKETKAKHLNLSSYSLQSIPKEVWSLCDLKTLELTNNTIEFIPKDIQNLKRLEYLFVSANRIQVLPPEIVNLNTLKLVKIGMNPLISPPIEIVSQGLSSMRNYYTSIQESDQVVKINEAKVLIVGGGGVGKTALMKRLIFNSFDQELLTTEGIDINQWHFEINDQNKFKVNFWDFGGQEIYHSTHQFFLTKRSLYLFVWEARKDDNLLSFDYWLNVVDLLGDSAPVIVVMNKMDERIRMIDEDAISQKFKNIKAFFKVSAQDGLNFQPLKDQIKTEIQKLDHIGDELPKVWLDIRNHLEDLNENYISIEDYQTICDSFGLNEERAIFLSKYFHDLGVFLHFSSSNILKKIVFLRPEWATNAAYHLIDSKKIQTNYGKFSALDLPIIWSEYPKNKYVYLLELLKRFELCFEIPNKNEFIIPELLKSSSPKIEWKNKSNLNFEYHYDFMPAGLITRFIVRNHDIIKDNVFWKNGVIIEFDKTSAKIVNDQIDRKIKISLYGEHKREFLGIIRREFDNLHNSLNNLRVNEMIKCCCSKCKGANNPHFYRYRVIRKFDKSDIIDTICPKSVKEVNIKELLGEIKTIIYDEGGTQINIDSINIRDGQTNFADLIQIIRKKKYGN